MEEMEITCNDSDSCSPSSSGKKESRTNQHQVYLPGASSEENRLVCDESAYIMLHHAATGSPCLSFDIIPSHSTGEKEKFPYTAHLVSGTQAPKSHANNIIVMEMSNMHKTQKFKTNSDSEESSDENSDEDEKDIDKNAPQLTCALINHHGCVNRIRIMTFDNNVLAASWSEEGKVHIWNLDEQLQAVSNRSVLAKYAKDNTKANTKPLFTFRGHQTEGYGLDWCPCETGVLASGDCRNGIHIWHPSEGATWLVDQRPLIGHIKSVEDLQWSPNEKNVLASCSVDKSIRIWDTRSTPSTACKLTVENAHDSDVNVISWNRNDNFILSGGDDGVVNVWDLRHFKSKCAVATFKHHTQPVTTVEWHPQEETVFASGGSDDQIVLWDLAVEKDDVNNEDEVENLPSQVLFIHQGQKDIKELHWHPQFSGFVISTALNGFNVFKTISV